MRYQGTTCLRIDSKTHQRNNLRLAMAERASAKCNSGRDRRRRGAYRLRCSYQGVHSRFLPVLRPDDFDEASLIFRAVLH